MGKDSDQKRCRKAIETLTDATRNIQAEEKFINVYNRLKNIDEEMIGADAAVKTHYIEKIFNANITPQIRSFLLEQNATEKTTKEICVLLDKCQKYKKNTNIFLVSAETSDEKIENMTNMIQSLADQNTALLEQNKSILHFMKTKFHDLDVKLNKIKSESKPEFQQKKPKAEFENKGQRPIPTTWERDQNGLPVRCNRCGFQGHLGVNCRGTCRATCNICRKQGHIAPACPELQNRQISKN
jgi:hypothetical protein